MALFSPPDPENGSLRRDIRITGTNQIENYTVYRIEITVNDCTWSVQHRYSEFVELNDRLIAIDNGNKSLSLPPKKLLGNSSKAFIQKRQKELEVYLQTALNKNLSLPRPLLHFLEFDIYDINGVSQALAAELYEKGDTILKSEDVCEMTPMQLYAITERLKLPLPTCETGDARSDIGHIMDFIAQLQYLRIVGSHNKLGNSSRKVDQLPFDVSHFKSLKHLQIDVCDVKLINGLEELKPCLAFLAVHHSASNLTEILLPCANQWLQSEDLKEVNPLTTIIPTWNVLKTADFKYNRLKKIDETVKLLPALEQLDLSHNEISQIDNLQHLSNLTYLDLSHNSIVQIEGLHSKLGNVRVLNISGNKLQSLKGFSKLYSVASLDLSENCIEEMIEVEHISNLPCIESLVLKENAVTSVVDYRTKVFELFQERYAEMKLDGQPASQKERDTVAVLKAIQISKDNEQRMIQHRSTQSPHKKKHSSTVYTAAIADPDEPGNNGKTTLLSLAQSIERPQDSQDQEFRSRVEALQKEGGQSWLTMFNELQESSPTPSPSGTPKAGRSPVMSRRSKSPNKMPNRSPNRSPNRLPKERSGVRSPNRSPNRSPKSSRKVHSPEENMPTTSERFLSPTKAEAINLTSATCNEESSISPKTLANLLCSELQKHRAQDITSIKDILSVVFYYDGSHLCTFGPRHRQTGELPPANAGLSALAVSLSMSEEKQKEFLDALQGIADGDSLSETQSLPVCSGGKTTSQADMKDLVAYVESVLQNSCSVLNTSCSDTESAAPLQTEDGKLAERVVKSELEQDVVDSGVRQHTTSHLRINVKSSSSSSLKAVLPDYEQCMLDHLTSCNKNINICLSKSMQNIAGMDGANLVKFFHEKVAYISTDVEKLKHIIWTGVIPFIYPCKELMSCVMLSSKGLYVISDEACEVTCRSPSPISMGHRRMKSDSSIGQLVRTKDHSGIVGFNSSRADKCQDNAGGVLHCPRDSSPGKLVKCQMMMKLIELEEVIMGLFDQKLRLTSKSAENTIALMTRSFHLTHEFRDHLMSVLPTADCNMPHTVDRASSGIDFYKSSRNRTESTEYIHPSKVKFCYPNNETINDLTYLIVVNIKGKAPAVGETNIILYMLVYQIISNNDPTVRPVIIQEPSERNKKSPRTLVITNRHLTLCKEDHVSYPLPPFSKMLPENQHYDIQEIQPIENLRRLVVSDFSSNDVSLVFEVMDVNVDISCEYYSATTEGQRRSPVSPEIVWSLVLPTFEDRERLIKLLCSQVMEISGEELSIQVST